MTIGVGHSDDRPLHATAGVALPTVHEAGLPQGAPALPGVNVQPLTVLQPSTVHGLLSLQTADAPATQAPETQVSAVVHALLSLHVAPLALGGFEQMPVVGLQAPAVWH